MVTRLLVFMKSELYMNRPKGVRWLLPVCLFVGGLLFFSDPGHRGVHALVAGNACFVAFIVWMYFRCRDSQDEVVRAANEAALSIGAPIGLGFSFLSIFIVRLFPTASSWVENLVGGSNRSDAVTAGFGVGVLVSCLFVVLSSILVWIAWWAGKR